MVTWRRLCSTCGLRAELEREAASAGVEVVKWLGDGAMLAAPDSSAMLTCLWHVMRAMQDAETLPLRAGVAIGPVTRVELGDRDYLGMTANRAARLCAVAEPWQVRTGAEVESVRFILRPRTPGVRVRIVAENTSPATHNA